MGKKIKTLKEFEYDLFRNDKGAYFTRIKQTGEIQEVSIEVFRYLRNQAMNIYRSKKGKPIYGVKNGKSVVIEYKVETHLSLDEIESELGNSWLIDNYDFEEEIVTELFINEFEKTLTKKQLETFRICLLSKVSFDQFAKAMGVSKQSIHERVTAIRKKYINFK